VDNPDCEHASNLRVRGDREKVLNERKGLPRDMGGLNIMRQCPTQRRRESCTALEAHEELIFFDLQGGAPGTKPLWS
jgi:hypothetical protein